MTKILIIDDNETDLIIIKDCLIRKGDEYTFILVESGEEGVIQAREQRPDIVIADTNLPGIDGFETCRQIKAIDGLDTKVIVMTGFIQSIDAVKARSMGADEYAAKTSDGNSIVDCVRAMEASNRKIESSHNFNLLVVDDSTASLNLFVEMFKEKGVDVDTALSGQEALGKIQKNNYDVCFMDLCMPDMDGLETTKCIRERLNVTVPIIALTIVEKNEGLAKALASGMNDYLLKPLNADEIESRILKWGLKR